MKRHILSFTLLLLLGTQGKGQTSVYHAFPDSNAVWCEYGDNLQYPDLSEVNFKQFINGDTIINSITYHKIYDSGIQDDRNLQNDEIEDTSSYRNRYDGAIRQDTNTKSIYIYPAYGSEALLYDFNLSLYDTVPALYDAYPVLIVSKIDSIFDGFNFRKQYFIGPDTVFSDYYTSIIEGIGSTQGLFYPIGPPFESGGALHCFINNDVVRYTDSTANACELFTSVKNIENNFGITLYPNPATNQLTIHSSFHNEAVTVSVINLLGQETSPPAPLQGRGEDATIDVSGLAAGMYFLQLKTVSGSVVKRFVKE